ncbi:hypothetical protein JAAARDRAFT_61029 [Jaapia argillacea MUCL 33604]|uniref:Calpain catalytic domain-containing protein n=1 Tax=Jaapia argillacea MUCL 33604 TaxID=933084 RepID=A0A067PUE5_9AGAM|nr:hypothetical protein JAAARDRAFT_61029 [Jaapia argillacea MUCL 33604]
MPSHKPRPKPDASSAKSKVLESQKIVKPAPPKGGPVQFSQRKDKAGLLVTEELQKAIERCKSKVEAITQECRRRNRRFRDIEFDLDQDQSLCVHGLTSDEFSPEDARRVPQIFNNPQFFIDSASSNDIVQGNLGDCWFLSALVIVSTMPGLIEKICVARDEKVGVYGFIFYRDAGWEEVIIDDLLCLSVPQYETLDGSAKNLYKQDKDAYNEMARKGSKSLYFAQSGTENETWVPLLEKAYAKLHGDYAALEGGFTCEALEDLTGGVASDIPVMDILDEDLFWKEELCRVNRGRLFGCSLDTSDGDWEVNDKRFLMIRNPWGRSEWTGRWSDGSKEWTTEWLQALPALGHSFGDDGAFLMEYKDFLSTWNTIARTVLFDSTWTMSSQWLNVTSRPYPCAWSFGDISFTFSIPKATPAVIVLAKLNDRHFEDVTSCYNWSVDFLLYKKGDKEHIGTSAHGYYRRRSVNLEINLEAGDYVVHVRLDRYPIDGREKSHPEDCLDGWDARKLSRKMTEMSTSNSIAASEKHDTFLPLRADSFAGQDISEIEAIATSASQTVVAVKPGEGGDDEEWEDEEEATTENEEEGEEEAEAEEGEKEGGEEGEGEGEGGEDEDEDEDGVVTHEGYGCDGCGMTPIKGPRFHCLDSSCGDSYDLCEKCVDEEKHPADHKMLRINTPEEEDKYNLKDKIEGNENKITLGLRVYTKRDSPATVKGQLRHGTLLRWTKKQKDEKIGDNEPVSL